MSFCQFGIASSVILLGIVCTVYAGTGGENAGDRSNDARAQRYIEYLAGIRPLEIALNLADWTANVSGKEEDFQKRQAAEEALDRALSDPTPFAELKAIKQAGDLSPLVARQIQILYLEFLEKQVPAELLAKISEKSNAIIRGFNIFRPKVNGRELTQNEIRRILIESHDSAERKATWEASKKVGPVVVADLLKLAELRNEAAQKLGFSDYYAMRLHLMEQNEGQISKLFDELDELTRGPYRNAKAEIDASLAKNCGIRIEELRPWHYHDPFFQEVPVLEGALPDSVFKNIDIVAIDRKFYGGIGLPVDDVLERSDLYEKPGKCPHAFCCDIDRTGHDIRLLQNIIPNEEWLCTMLHESGHAVYAKNVGCMAQAGAVPFTPPLHYILHTDAGPLCTEGVAMMFERFGHNVDWLAQMGVNVPDRDRYRSATAKYQRYRMLVFARYCQVMMRFERELYRNPKQDLNRLWWDLVEKYQEIKRPEGRNEPDFATKVHIITTPVYYHNYMLGEMFASQLHHAMIRAILKPDKSPLVPMPLSFYTYVGDKRAGEFLRERVFAPGLTLNWSELTKHATGEELNAKAFGEDTIIFTDDP